jgi:hypothetical protein
MAKNFLVIPYKSGKNEEEDLENALDSLEAVQLRIQTDYEEEYWRWQRFTHYCRTGNFPD